jgi:WD40 repeat protein
LSWTKERKAVVFDLASGEVRASLAGSDGLVFYNLAFSPDSKKLAVAVGREEGDLPSHSLQLWDISTGKLCTLHEFPAKEADNVVHSIVFSPDSKMLAFGGKNRVFLTDSATGQALRQFEINGIASGLALLLLVAEWSASKSLRLFFPDVNN